MKKITIYNWLTDVCDTRVPFLSSKKSLFRFKFGFLPLLFVLLSYGGVIAQTQLGLDIDGEAVSNFSGSSVSLSSDGSRVAIGAPGPDGFAGHVRVYDYSSGSWIQMGGDIDGEAAGDFSGVSVSLSSDGSRVAIGANRNDGSGSNAGHVRVYEYSSGSWIQVGLDIDGEAAGDGSGEVSLSSDGSRVAIGADGNDGAYTGAGHVRVYEYSSVSSSWIQMGGDIDGEAAYDFSGASVSLSSDGSRVAIGAYRNNGITGHVRIYEYSSVSSSWIQMGGDIDGEAAYDFSGASVSLSSNGSRVAIGANGNDGSGSNAGHVRVYEYSSVSSSWIQMGGDIDGEATNDASGRSVSLSSNGGRVAIGAIRNDDSGSDAGHVRLYEYSSVSSSWIQMGGDIDGEATGDESGNSVSLSSDGSRVAIGAELNGGIAFFAGHVRVYDMSPPAPELDLRNNADNADITDGSTAISATLGTDFGNVCHGGTVSSSASFRAENNGTGVLTFDATAITLSNTTDFSITTGLSGTVAAGAFQTFTIEFDPASNGTRSCIVTINSDDADEDPYTFEIQGVGLFSTITIAATTPSIAEDGATDLVYTFTRDCSVGALVVYFSIEGTASDSDYTLGGETSYLLGSNTGTITFADGASTAIMTVTPNDDSMIEASETVIVKIMDGE